MPDLLLSCGDICRVSDDCVPGPKCGLCPLSRFFPGGAGSLPEIFEIAPEEIPQPQRQLLAPERDMTTTLEEYHACRTNLRVLRQETLNDVHHREVLLTLDGTNLPVEFGAISIRLVPLPPLARQAVLEARRPLGGLLHEFGVRHVSRPKAFIRVAPDPTVAGALGLGVPETLYGRCNALLTCDGQVLADIVEILPP